MSSSNASGKRLPAKDHLAGVFWGRARALPWGILLSGAGIVGRRWGALTADERAGLARLVCDSRGRIRNLNIRERRELRRLVRKLELPTLGREAMALFGRGRSRRRP